MSEHQRNAVLDADPVYQANAGALAPRYHQKKINLAEWQTYQAWLTAAALRRLAQRLKVLRVKFTDQIQQRRAA